MQTKIEHYLRQIESENDIKILLACETGSRAWGFASPDSDYDVRFLYKHPRDWYLSLHEPKDSIELMYENKEIDLSGWDLKKSLGLLWKSNPPLLERIQSPIVYRADADFLEGMQHLAQHTYSKIATMHHYLSMAKNIFIELEHQSEVKLKKLFYCLRTSIACWWILERSVMPPIVFGIMLHDLPIPPLIKERIETLIALKATQSEAYLHPQEAMLNEFIRNILQRAEQEAKKLPAGTAKLEDLSAFFRKTLNAL